MKTLKLFFGLMTLLCLSFTASAQDEDISTDNSGDGQVGINTDAPLGPLHIAPPDSPTNPNDTNNYLKGGLILRTMANRWSSISHNAYHDGSGWKRLGSGSGSMISFTPFGEIRFRNFGTGGVNSPIVVKDLMKLLTNGKVLIGTAPTNTTSDYKLYVQTGILTEKVKVATVDSDHWADYVFEENYELNTIEEVETFVKTNKHLPNVPSAKEVEANGVEMVEMDVTLLRQVEELWLHTIDINKEKEVLQEENATLITEVEALQVQNEQLTEQVENLTEQFHLLLNKVEALETQPK